MQQLPDNFVRQMDELLGADESRALCDALAGEAPVSLRLHPRKGCAPAAAMRRVPWCASGFYLPERPAFTFDPLLHAGAYYVQEAASMFVEQAFRTLDFRPRRVLDLCAAPGGKSTLWRSLLPDDALLVANEPLPARAAVLAENMAKWGHADVLVSQAWPAEFAALGGFFDVIAADVPCSGEGMFRKDSGAVGEWSTGNVAQCAARQWQIVCDVWPALREGGYLVYSTCTFNRHEDEDNVERICRELGAEAVPVDCPAEWGICGDTTGRGLPVSHFFPHRTEGEGFFLALLRKTASAPAAREKRNRPAARGGSPAGCAEAAGWLRRPEEFRLLPAPDGGIAAVRRLWEDDARRVAACVRLLACGLDLAGTKGRKTVPAAALALSLELRGEAFPRVELAYDEAIAYLRRETLCPGNDVPRGYVLACYAGRPIGFLNHIGPRANNLFPAEWRIRTSYLQRQDPVVETAGPRAPEQTHTLININEVP